METEMEFMTTTNRKQLALASRLREVADSMERHGLDVVDAISLRAVKWLVGYIREVAQDLEDAVRERPESFLDRNVAVFGRELELLQSLAEDQWLNLSDFTVEKE
jgi:hypothetical protein